MFEDLGSFLQELKARGDLVEIERSVTTKFDIAAGMRKTSDIGGPALLFSNVAGHDIPVVGALYAHWRRLYAALGVDQAEFFTEYLARLRNPIPPVIVSSGPCKEVITTGYGVDLTRLPVCWHSERDGGPYVMMGLQFTRDPELGRNLAVARMQIHDATTATLLFGAHQHLGIHHRRAVERGEPLPVATVIGSDPYLMLASRTPGALGENEVDLAGGLAGRPVVMIKCETIDVEVPANAEIVIEGLLSADEKRWEGPFGDMTGYYSPAGDRPLYQVTAITHRRDPIYLTGLAGKPMSDNHVLRAANYEAFMWEKLKRSHPTIKDICWTDGGAGTMHAAISMTPRSATEAREVMLAAFEFERVRPKLAIVCDEDVDVRDPRQVEWAMAFRMQGDRDIEIVPQGVGSILDPSAPEPRVSALVAIDATKSYGRDYPELVDVPGAEDFEIPGWRR